MNKQMLTIFATATLMSLPTVVCAATAIGTLNATAFVTAKCIVSSTTNVVFGSIDPTTNGNYDGAGTIVTKCSKGTLEFLFIAPSVAGPLAMKSPTTLDSINYSLYSDAGRTSTFPGVLGGAKTTQSGTAVTTNVYGRVVVGTGINDTITAASDYTQALTATIEW